MTADGKQLVGLTTNSEDGLTKYTDKLKDEIKNIREMHLYQFIITLQTFRRLAQILLQLVIEGINLEL